jgi:hypothetical protein
MGEINGRNTFAIQTSYTYKFNNFPKYMIEVLNDPEFYGYKMRDIVEMFDVFKRGIENDGIRMSSGESFKVYVSSNYTITVVMTVDDELYNKHRRKQVARRAYKFYQRLRGDIKDMYQMSYRDRISNIETANDRAELKIRYASISFLNAKRA